MDENELENGIIEDTSQDEEILEQSSDQVSEQVSEQPEPLIIETKGKWQPFEVEANVELVEGHTYQIDVNGLCEFATGKERPTSGLRINSFPYTKEKNNRLWIRTL